MAASLIACDRKAQTIDPPGEITPPSTGGTGLEAQAASVAMNFSMPYANSVFNSVYIDEFDIANVTYSFVYYAADGSELSSKRMGSLSEDMVDEADRPLLKQAGNHYINVTAQLDGGEAVKGKFQLRLKDRTEKVSSTELRFRTERGVMAFFGQPRQIDGVSYTVCTVDAGTQFASWAEFCETFRFVRKDHAITSISYNDPSTGTRGTLSENSAFPFTIGKVSVGRYYSFTINWTEDVVRVKFDLNLPQGAQYFDGESDPANLFKDNGQYANVNVVRGAAAVTKPDTSLFNKYYGLYFSGWYLPQYDDAGNVKTSGGKVVLDRLWDFSKAVEKDITLYAKWAGHSYSYVIYPMGGSFKADIAPATHSSDGEDVPITLENYAEFGYTLLASSTKFTNAGALMRVSFEGFNYGDDYAKYVAEVTVDATGTKVMLLFSDIYAGATNRVFQKNDECLEMGGLYTDYCCETEYAHDGYAAGKRVSVDGDRVGYIGWHVKEGKLNDYLVDMLFNFGIKADGSVRIESARDNSVNVIKIPATVNLDDGVERPVTEIADRACSNLKSLREVDASEAVNLTTIGKEAFAFDSNLTSFIQPQTGNNITVIGKDAFANTAYEERYTSISGLDFIIINKVIYKYTGTPENGVVDLTVSNYYTAADFAELAGVIDPATAAAQANAQLNAATHIMDGAFEGVKDFQEIRLSGAIEDIQSGAFRGLEKLAKVTVPKENKLSYIGAGAFEDCELFLSEESGNYVGEQMHAIVIGNIYYYQVDRDIDQVVVKATYGEDNMPITKIAAGAFNGCVKLSDISFEAEDAITYVGADAFRGTAFLEKNDPNFVVVNNILAEFYGPTTRFAAVPDGVTEISESAFGETATSLATVEIPLSVAKIGANAFVGAANLKTVILSSISAEDEILQGAPDIDVTAFANKSGVMNEELTLYFSNSVMALFESYADKDAAQIQDARTRTWVELYKLNSEHFAEELITKVKLSDGAIKTVFVDDGTEEIDEARALQLFTNYLNGLPEGALDNIVEVIGNTGETRLNALSLDKITLKKVSAEYDKADKDGIQFVLDYAYDDANYPDVFDDAETDAGAVVLSFYKAIKGNYKFYSVAEPTTYSYSRFTNPNGNIYVKGLAGNATGQGVPTYFTGTDESSLKDVAFVYTDVANVKHEIAIDVARIRGFELSVEEPAGTATIDVDFHGAGTYRIVYNYAVRKAKYSSVEQREAVKVLLNTDAAAVLRDQYLTLVGEDGKTTRVAIAGNFTLGGIGSNSRISSDSLGQKKVYATYNRSDECVNSLAVGTEIVYTVVLEANPANFAYEIIEEATGGNHGTAKIVGYINANAASVTTIIIPATYTDQNGNVYDIVQLGEISSGSEALTGLFARCANLQVVYLSSGLQRIGARVFDGCTKLRSIRSAVASSTDEAILSAKNFEILYPDNEIVEQREGGAVSVRSVRLVNLDDVAYYQDDAGTFYGLCIGAEYNFGETDDKGRTVIYRVVEISDALKLPARTDAALPVYLYFPSTVYSEVSVQDANGSPVKDGADGYNIIFYESGKGRFIVYDRLNPELTYIGNNAFRGCVSLRFTSESFSTTTNLRMFGVSAFAGTGITSIDLSKTQITEINNNMFEGCDLLESVKLPENKVTGILTNAFYGCSMLGTIEGLGDKLSMIAQNAFANCLSLKSFKLGAGVQTIEENAFGNCRALVIECQFASTQLPRGWHSRWNNFNCPVVYTDSNGLADGLAYHVADDGVRYMLDPNGTVATVIAQSYDIVTASIPATLRYGGKDYTVNSIAANAFDGCGRLTSVSITENITSIGNYAFRNCASLSSFTFTGDNGLVSVGQDAFAGCTQLSSIPGVAREFERGDFKYSINRADNTVTVIGLSSTRGESKERTIEDTVDYAGVTYTIVAIGEGAFMSTSDIETLTLGANIRSIGTNAFFMSQSIKKIIANAALKRIEAGAFSGCSSLSEFENAKELEFIGDEAFEGCADGFVPPTVKE